MSRLTGTDAYGLMEAYNNVYAPQELTEEQVWEEVENWVNSLLEEGYDLSDYTWEEMYEAYVTEGDNYDKNRQRAAKRAAERNAARDRGQTGNVPGVGYVTSRREGETYRDSAGVERHTSGAKMPKKDVKEERRDPRGRVASGPMSVYGGRGTPSPDPEGDDNVSRMDRAQRRVKRTQPSAKGMAADALFTKYSARQSGAGGEEGPGPKAPKRSGRSGRGANTDRGSGNAARRRMSEDFDLFDTILEHLVSEGYADTNESALVIMANMSEEWRQSIVEGEEDYRPLPRRKMLNKANKLRKSGDVNKKAKSADIEYQLRAHSPEASKTSSYVNRAYGRGSDG